MRTVLLLGSNMGDREDLMKKAVEEIRKSIGSISAISSLYETEAWGFQAETPFLNCAVISETAMDPYGLLEECLRIEARLGRTRSGEPGYRSRTMDIDIIFYGDEIIASDTLVIPHPRLAERKFVLAPLLELIPDYMHPTVHKSIKNLYKTCKDPLKVKKLRNMLL